VQNILINFVTDRFRERFAPAWPFWASQETVLRGKIKASMQRIRQRAAREGTVLLTKKMQDAAVQKWRRKRMQTGDGASTTGEADADASETTDADERGGARPQHAGHLVRKRAGPSTSDDEDIEAEEQEQAEEHEQAVNDAVVVDDGQGTDEEDVD
jgi:hypothetical protein